METKTEKLPKTTKKQKFVGIKEFIDSETGEIIPMQINQVEERDFNFHKFWLKNFIEGVDGITNKKMKLAFWIVDNLNSENQLLYTFQQMAEKTRLSYDTVIKTMKELQKGDPPFLKKLHAGLYQVNPDIIYKGNHRNRMGVIYQFGNIASKDVIEKKKAFDEQEEAIRTKAKTTESSDTTDTTVADDTVTSETSADAEVATDTTTATRQSKGRTPKPKPENWSEIKAKIIAKEITKAQALKELNIKSANTLNKWLAEND